MDQVKAVYVFHNKFIQLDPEILGKPADNPVKRWGYKYGSQKIEAK